MRHRVSPQRGFNRLTLIVAAIFVVSVPYLAFTYTRHANSTPPAPIDGASSYLAALSEAESLLRERNQVPQVPPAITDHPAQQQQQPRIPSIPPPPPPIPASSHRNESPKRHLVVGLGTGIPPENLAVFCGSLKEVSPNTDIVLYLDSPLPDLHQQIVKKYDVIALEFAVTLIEPPFLREYHPSNYRWPLIYRFLNQTHQKYDKVLLADVRDSMFQVDPFEKFSSGFHAFHGVESRTIGQCGWNGGWVKDCFGNDMLSRISRERIICSGVSMGSTSDVLNYLSLMQATMETPQFAKCERNGVDQGVHNVLVHNNRIPHLSVHSQADGWVANLQAQQAVIKNNRVTSKRGHEYAVVHQYDRYPALLKHYYDRFTFWQRLTDDQLCAAFTLTEDSDKFFKRCDLAVSGAHSTGDCCQKCNANK